VPDWIWIDVKTALATHDEQLAAHGGAAGLRDGAMLESAMARPLDLVALGEPDAADLAASYAFGIARNRPFVDGNKRTALVVSETFLALNGYRLTASDAEVVVTFLALAAGELTAEDLAAWFRTRSPRTDSVKERYARRSGDAATGTFPPQESG
jgi:death-on-curing protein